MTYSSLKLLGLCVILLGVMAFAADATHAESGAKWLIEGVDAASLPASIDAEIEYSSGSLLTEILGIAVEILCTEGKLVGMKLEGEGKVTNGGKAKFFGCSVDLEGSPSACTPHSIGAPVATIETNNLKGLLALVLAGVASTVVVAKEGTTLANIDMGEECPVGENVPVRGTLALADSGLATQSVNHLVVENASHSDLWVLSKTAEHKATLDGSAWIFLQGGEHLALKWSGDVA
jgi:hypothetical protein